MKTKNPYEYNLILATAVVLFIISAICIYGMFYFKIAQIHEMPAAVKIQYMDKMNAVISPFIIALILLLGICVPKRILPVKWLNRFAAALIPLAIISGWVFSIQSGLLLILIASLILQVIVLVMAVQGNERLHFEKKGYWVRLGSSLIHLGLILFVFDLFFHDRQILHLVLFWITTISIVLGMIFCFYSDSILNFIIKIQERKAS